MKECHTPRLKQGISTKLKVFWSNSPTRSRDISPLPPNFPRIIAITGHVEPDYIQKAYDKGMDRVFPKPLPVVELGVELMNLNFISEIPEKVLKGNKQ